MALHPVTVEGPHSVARRRGQSQRVVIRLDDAMAGPIEGVAFAGEVLAIVARIGVAVAAGSRAGVENERNRLGSLTLRFRDECRRLAAMIEGPDAA